MSNRIYIEADEGQLILSTPTDNNMIVITEQSIPQIVEVSSPGIQGPRGPAGSGISEPFAPVISGRLYDSTASISVNASISSSWIPQTGSNGLLTTFSLGSILAPWKSLFVASQSSIIFSDGQTNLVSMSAGLGYIQVGTSKITTSSFGFSTYEIIKNMSTYVDVIVTGSINVKSDGTHSPITATSQSKEYFKVNESGLLILGEFTYTPTAVSGGIFYSASNWYVGTE